MVATIVGIPLCISINIKQPLYIASIVVILFLLIKHVLGNIDVIKKESMSDASDSVRDSVGTEIKIKDAKYFMDDDRMGPLDGLEPEEMHLRLKYATYVSGHPYLPMSYSEFKTYEDEKVNRNLDENDENVKDARRFYPQLSKRLFNYKDCTNQGFGYESCNISSDSANLFPHHNGVQVSMLVDGINNEKILKKVVREDFKAPIGLYNNELRGLFKNSPRPLIFEDENNIQQSDKCGNKDYNYGFKVAIDDRRGNVFHEGISKDLCRGCKVGLCKHGDCYGVTNLLT